MYKSRVRPDSKGRKLVAQQPKQLPNADTSCGETIPADAFLKSLPTAASPGRIAFLTLTTLCVVAISGCGVLHNSLGTSQGSVILSQISCGTQSLTGPQSKTCSLSLNSAALASITVKLSTNNPALKVPSDVKIAVGQSSANFDVVTAGVSTTATVTIKASYRGVTKSSTLTLYPAGTGSGSQTSTQHKVQLSWNAPAALSVTVAGYNVYRATSGVSSYARLNPSVDTVTNYIDAGVQSGLTYNYVVKSVDSSGTESSPSNPTQVTIP